MATTKQRSAARKNIGKAQRAATKKRTIAHLPQSTRRSLVAEAQRARRRGGRAGHALEDWNRAQLYETARVGESLVRKYIEAVGRELVPAIRAAR